MTVQWVPHRVTFLTAGLTVQANGSRPRVNAQNKPGPIHHASQPETHLEGTGDTKPSIPPPQFRLLDLAPEDRKRRWASCGDRIRISDNPVGLSVLGGSVAANS